MGHEAAGAVGDGELPYRVARAFHCGTYVSPETK